VTANAQNATAMNAIKTVSIDIVRTPNISHDAGTSATAL
jgi:hypothetical protein